MSDHLSDVEERRRQTSLRDLICIALRHKWKMLLFFLAVVASVTVLSLCAAEIYRSEAKLLVRLGRESVTLDPTATTGQIAPVVRSRESEILTESDILKSRRIAEKVVDLMGPNAILKGSANEISDVDSRTAGPFDRIARSIRSAAAKPGHLLERAGLRKPLSDRDEAVLNIMKNSEITTEKEISNIINISFEAERPQLAQQILTKVIDTYLEERVAVHETPGSYEFFAEQSGISRSRLAQLEQKLQSLQKGTSMSSIDEEIRVTLGRIGSLETEVDRAESSLAASRARAQKLRETLAALPETVVTTTTTGFSNDAADRMRERLYELQLKEQDLLSKYRQDSRQIQEVRRQITEAQALLEKEQPVRTQTTRGLNSAQQQTESALLAEEANLSSFDAEVKELKRRLTGAQAQLQNLNDTAAEMRRLNREIEIQEESYRKYSGSLEQARIDQALKAEKISNITVVQPATLPIRPVRPRKLLQLLLGVLLGAFGAAVLAFVCEYVDHTIKTPQEAEEKLGLPVLASVPRARENAICPVEREKRSFRGNGGVAATASDQWDIPSSVRGHYEVLSQRILSCSGDSRCQPQVFAVTGSHRGEGASSVVANLAAALSRRGEGRVLVVDANLACPSLHKIFHVKAPVGLVDILFNWTDFSGAVFSSPVDNLSLLPAGTINGHHLDGIRPTELEKMLNHLKKKYRFIIIDLPAVEEFNWAVRLAGICDGVGLVVEAEKSRWESVLAAKEQLQMSKANILGVVLNKRRFRVPKWLYRAL